jgi:hypothetical protein
MRTKIIYEKPEGTFGENNYLGKGTSKEWTRKEYLKRF